MHPQENRMTHTTIAELTVEEFKQLVREVVIQALREVFGDPDEGLELREDFAAALERSLDFVAQGGRTTAASEVAARRGLTW
jgi:hypothetical protein